MKTPADHVVVLLKLPGVSVPGTRVAFETTEASLFWSGSLSNLHRVSCEFQPPFLLSKSKSFLVERSTFKTNFPAKEGIEYIHNQTRPLYCGSLQNGV